MQIYEQATFKRPKNKGAVSTTRKELRNCISVYILGITTFKMIKKGVLFTITQDECDLISASPIVSDIKARKRAIILL